MSVAKYLDWIIENPPRGLVAVTLVTYKSYCEWHREHGNGSRKLHRTAFWNAVVREVERRDLKILSKSDIHNWTALYVTRRPYSELKELVKQLILSRLETATRIALHQFKKQYGRQMPDRLWNEVVEDVCRELGLVAIREASYSWIVADLEAELAAFMEWCSIGKGRTFDYRTYACQFRGILPKEAFMSSSNSLARALVDFDNKIRFLDLSYYEIASLLVQWLETFNLSRGNGVLWLTSSEFFNWLEYEPSVRERMWFVSAIERFLEDLGIPYEKIKRTNHKPLLYIVKRTDVKKAIYGTS